MNLTKPLTNLQLELLKIYQFELEEHQLFEIRDLLSKYFADYASDEMEKMWEEEVWTNETMNTLLKGDQKSE